MIPKKIEPNIIGLTIRFKKSPNEYQILLNGKSQAESTLSEFLSYAKNKGLLQYKNNTLPFENSISVDLESDYPGDWDTEEKIRHFIRRGKKKKVRQSWLTY